MTTETKGSLLPTIEMIFKCTVCENTRQYGCAGSLMQKPDNFHPQIRCYTCGRGKPVVTEHVYVQNQWRTAARERYVVSNLADLNPARPWDRRP